MVAHAVVNVLAALLLLASGPPRVASIWTPASAERGRSLPCRLAASPPLSPGLTSQGRAGTGEDVLAMNYVLGTQQVGPNYSFNMSESVLLETAAVITDMGSNFIKLRLDVTKYARTKWVVNGVDYTSASTNLNTIASQHPDFVQVFDNPRLRFYHLWTYTTSSNIQGTNMASFYNNQSALDREYQNIYGLAKLFLTKYAGTGKVFMLGNWEGDWHLLEKGSFKLKDPLGPEGMVAWVNTRQQAVDDAKRDVQSTGVEVYHYMEMNKASLVLTKGPEYPCVLNSVLPRVNVDFVSYSCYESLKLAERPWFTTLRQVLDLALSRIPPKQLTNRLGPGVEDWWGSRLFLGEYGFFTGPDALDSLFPEDAAARTVALAKVVFQYRLPFMLIWQLYNNELTATGAQKGYWLIDNNNIKQPTYYVHQLFYQAAKAYICEYVTANGGQAPTAATFAAYWASQVDTQLLPQLDKVTGLNVTFWFQTGL